MNIICILRQCWSGGAPYHPANCCFNIRHFLWRGIDSGFGDLFQKLIFSVHNLLNLEKVTFFNDTYLSPCLNKLHIALRQYFKSANHKFVVFWNRSSRATNHLDPPFHSFPSLPYGTTLCLIEALLRKVGKGWWKWWGGTGRKRKE